MPRRNTSYNDRRDVEDFGYQGPKATGEDRIYFKYIPGGGKPGMKLALSNAVRKKVGRRSGGDVQVRSYTRSRPSR